MLTGTPLRFGGRLSLLLGLFLLIGSLFARPAQASAGATSDHVDGSPDLSASSSVSELAPLVDALVYRPRYGPNPSAEPTLRGEFEMVTGGLDFVSGLTAAPDGRLYASEFRTGRIVVLDPDGHAGFSPQTFATVPLPPMMAREQGLWQVAVHPEQPFVYATAVAETDSENDYRGTARVVRFPILADGSSGPLEEVITGLPAASVHNGGALAFGPDGKLYVAVGDVGSEDQVPGEALAHVWYPWQPVRLSELRGTILRFNPDGSIPNDGVLRPDSPLFAYGFRNVYGMAFGPDGRLYVTENGPECCDQVIRVEPGRDHGWPRYGNRAGEMLDKANDSSVVPPLVHSDEWRPSPTQVVYYDGDGYGEEIWGSLFYGNFHTATLHRIWYSAEGGSAEEIVLKLPTALVDGFAGPGGIVGVASAADGWVYFASLESVYRLNGLDRSLTESIYELLGPAVLEELSSQLANESRRAAGEAEQMASSAIVEPGALAGHTYCPPGQPPSFLHGFAWLSSLVGDEMGAPITCEFVDPSGTGDAYQVTTMGLAWWSSSTNSTSFSNGWETWTVSDRLDYQAGPPSATGSSTEQDYEAHVAPLLAGVGHSLERLHGLIRAHDADDPGWTLELANELMHWRAAHAALMALDPPAEWEVAHVQYLDALTKLQAAIPDLLIGLQRVDGSRLEEAVQILRHLDGHLSDSVAADDPLLDEA